MIYFSKNLRHLRKKHNRLTQEKLAHILHLTRSVISSYEDGRAEPNIATLISVSSYFDVSIENLTNLDLENVDEKQVEHQRALKKYASAQNLKVITVTSDKNNQRFINLVPEKASAGYTSGYASAEYLKELPAYQLPFLSSGRMYRAFEISGDSMLPLKDKSIVIGEYVENIRDVKDGEVCIVISKSDGIVLKKVYNEVEKNGCILLKSSNIAYEPYELNIAEVLELWRYTAYISREFPEEYDGADDLKRAFSRLEYEMQDLKMNQVKKDN